MFPSAAYKVFLWTEVSVAPAGAAPPLPLSTWLVTPPPPVSPLTSYSDGPAGWLPPSPLLWSIGQLLADPSLPPWLWVGGWGGGVEEWGEGGGWEEGR